MQLKKTIRITPLPRKRERGEKTLLLAPLPEFGEGPGVGSVLRLHKLNRIISSLQMKNLSLIAVFRLSRRAEAYTSIVPLV